MDFTSLKKELERRFACMSNVEIIEALEKTGTKFTDRDKLVVALAPFADLATLAGAATDGIMSVGVSVKDVLGAKKLLEEML